MFRRWPDRARSASLRGMSDTPAKSLVLIDGSGYIFRAFFALPVENFSTVTGQHTNAVFGFTSMLINVLRDERPTHLAVAFDVSRASFRTEQYPEYKAKRATSPEEFKGQVTLIKEVLDALRIAHVELPGYEADDLIGSALEASRRQALRGVIVSADKDLSQLLLEHDEQWDYARNQRWGAGGVKARHGVHAHQIADYLALCGDAAHPMRPYLAQGAGMAIEDAVELEKSLAMHDVDVALCLRRYALNRWQRNARVQERFPHTLVLHGVREVVHTLAADQVSRVGLLATRGTYSTGLYQRELVQRSIETRLGFLKFANLHFISAIKRQGLAPLWASIAQAHKAATCKMSTPVLTRVLLESLQFQTPKKVGAYRPKMRYAHQGGMNPPIIVIHGNSLNLVTDAYKRFLEGRFRKEFNLVGTPLRVEFKTADNPYAEKNKK